jgi:hypothetical protein
MVLAEIKLQIDA